MMTSPTNFVPSHSRSRLIDVAITVNPTVHGAWAASQMKLAAAKISTGVCSPAERHMIEARLAMLQRATRSSYLSDLAAAAQHYLAEMSHG
jgi:hypothetical protein